MDEPELAAKQLDELWGLPSGRYLGNKFFSRAKKNVTFGDDRFQIRKKVTFDRESGLRHVTFTAKRKH